jgi:plasmid stabilization system protein ParE
MRQVIWTNFAISELKKIFLYYRMVAGERTAVKIKKSIFAATKPLMKHPLIGSEEENLKDLHQGHRYIVHGNYKIIYRIIGSEIYITDIFDWRQDPTKMKRSVSKD